MICSTQAVNEGMSTEQLQRFIAQGYLHVPPDESLPAEFHEAVCASAGAMGSKGCGALGNNILPQLPGLQQVFETPSVRGALRRLLGDGYMMHPHRFCHATEPGHTAQTWHRDSYWGNWHCRHHTPHWMMALYFPQDTTIEMGPTGILPFTQYCNKDGGGRGAFGVSRFSEKDIDGGAAAVWGTDPMACTCKAGSVFLIHYDLWHRGSANVSEGGIRLMFKFQFSRMAPLPRPMTVAQPVQWRRYLGEYQEKGGAESRHPAHVLAPVWQHVWSLLCEQGCDEGEKTEQAQEGEHVRTVEYHRDMLIKHAKAGSGSPQGEPGRIAAAYYHVAAVPEEEHAVIATGMIALLRQEKHLLAQQGRVAMYALQAMGSTALEPLLYEPRLLMSSPYATGALKGVLEACPDGMYNAQEVLAVLQAAFMPQVNTGVRQVAAEALGCIRDLGSVQCAMGVLRNDGDGDVRATAGHSLLRLITCGVLDERTSGEVASLLADLESTDCDRYVTAYAAEGLHRLDLIASGGVEQGHFAPLVRWCSKGNGWNSGGDHQSAAARVPGKAQQCAEEMQCGPKGERKNHSQMGDMEGRKNGPNTQVLPQPQAHKKERKKGSGSRVQSGAFASISPKEFRMGK